MARLRPGAPPERQHGPLLGTLILVPLWARWHAPLFLTDWMAVIGGANARTILLFLGLRVALSLVITRVLDGTDESLPLVTVVHASENTFVSLLLVATFTHARRDEGRARRGRDRLRERLPWCSWCWPRGRPGHRPEPHAD